jgi:hypothetical protein
MFRSYSLFLAISASLALMVSSAAGGTLNLSDQNSSAAITPTSTAGLSNWTINGTNYANQQWFWYSVDGGAPAPLSSLTITDSNTFSTGGGGTQGGYVTFTGTGLSVKVIYMLTGGSTTTQSDLAETIRLTNTNSTAHTYHFYQYSSFNLSGGTTDIEQFTNGNTVSQSGGSLFMQTVTTPQPSAWEGGNMSSPNTLAKLMGGLPVTLSNTPAISTSTTYGPFSTGLTWAYQWDPTIAAGATYIISNDQQITPGTLVPEPSAATLLLACGGFVLMTGRLWPRRRAG